MKRQATATKGLTGQMRRTTAQRRERYPRKARRAEFLLVDIVKVQAECEALAEIIKGYMAHTWRERAETWKQREIRVQLWLHWEQGKFNEAKALLVKAEKQGQQDFFPLLAE